MLFKTTQEITSVLPVGAGNDFNRLKPHIENAENRFIAPLLGTSLYEELLEFYDEGIPSSPDEVQQAMIDLLKKVQHALIHLTLYSGYDYLNVNFSDSGFQRIESDKLKSLFHYQEENLKSYLGNSGFDGLDSVLTFIEDNIAHFNEFKLSTNWTEFKSMFIPSVRVLESIPYNIHGSRLTFLSLKPHMAFIEDTKIKKAVGVSIFDEIKAEMIKDEPAEKVIAILPYIRKPLIYFSVAMLMEETGATLDHRGLFFEQIGSNQKGNKTREISDPLTVQRLIARSRSIGESYLEALLAYLASNMESWPGFSATTDFHYNRDNNQKKIFFA